MLFHTPNPTPGARCAHGHEPRARPPDGRTRALRQPCAGRQRELAPHLPGTTRRPAAAMRRALPHLSPQEGRCPVLGALL
eukprot:170957-Chlamydomonas_euryale.AAC.11